MNKRVFLVIIDSLGIGSDDKSHLYNDDGANTLAHIFNEVDDIKLNNLQKLGLMNLCNVKGQEAVLEHPHSYIAKLNESSVGKDTMTGHWEMMGIKTNEPFITFTDTGFPKELVDELEAKTGYKYIGNYAASGTEIIEELGERHMETKELILYTSADSVLQIAANEDLIGLDELYRCCEVAREITMKKEWLLGRVIARPFVGDKKGNFTRTANRHDYALSPSSTTVLDMLKENGYDCLSVGKINDIFNTQGITYAVKSKSSVEGMKQTIDIAKNNDFNGICFTNLVDFDAKWGHRRNPSGYAEELKAFDDLLPELIDNLKEDDILMISADHGNDPTWHGSDHTREMVPLLVYSKSFNGFGNLGARDTFADIGATVADIFDIKGDIYGNSFKGNLL